LKHNYMNFFKEAKTIAKDKEKIESAEPGKVRTWFNDRGEDLHDFATDPYKAERLLAPFNALLNLCCNLADRCKAASAAGKAARAERRVERARNAEAKAALRAERAEKRTAAKARQLKAAVQRGAGGSARAALGTAAGVFIALGLVVNVMLILPLNPEPVLQDGAAVSGGSVNAAETVSASDSRADEQTHNAMSFAVQATVSEEDSFVSTELSADEISDDVASESTPSIYIKERNGVTKEVSDFSHHDSFGNSEPLHMIDVSSNQGLIDWEAVAQSDVDVVMIRVGYRGRMSGELYEDPMYKYNLDEAAKHGIPFGVYIYSQAISPSEAIEEADFVLGRIKGYELALPVAIDYEHESKSVYGKPGGRLYMAKLSKTKATEVVEAFCRVVSIHGYEPMLYANRDMLTRGLDADRISKRYRIWLACYAKEAGYSGKYSGWQYTDRGKVDGINSYVCLDFWYE